MKIPPEQCVYANSNFAKRLLQDWRSAASQIELEYGVWVEVQIEENSSTSLTRIYFIAMDHEFESVRDLRKALDNKAFM